MRDPQELARAPEMLRAIAVHIVVPAEGPTKAVAGNHPTGPSSQICQRRAQCERLSSGGRLECAADANRDVGAA